MTLQEELLRDFPHLFKQTILMKQYFDVKGVYNGIVRVYVSPVCLTMRFYFDLKYSFEDIVKYLEIYLNFTYKLVIFVVLSMSNKKPVP